MTFVLPVLILTYFFTYTVTFKDTAVVLGFWLQIRQKIQILSYTRERKTSTKSPREAMGINSLD
jgi:hypothetical protein